LNFELSLTPPDLPLACTVRDCGLPLTRKAASFSCSHGHSYDVARSGYVNLLQPQDRRSRAPGDSTAVIAARGRLLQSGVGAGVLERIVARVAALNLGEAPVVVDLGAGTGDALGRLAACRRIAGIGIDLAAAAADHAARRFPDLTWVVANADRRLPLVDRSIDLVMSLYGRRNATEAARVLKPSGYLLAAVPAADDLIELRSAVQGEASPRERMAALVAEHEPYFTVVERFEAREHAHLDRATLLDLLRASYRGARTSASDRIDRLSRLDVTIASDCVLMKLVNRSRV
jgi:23S rRNA (guanine745-N1)-methyltransferase